MTDPSLIAAKVVVLAGIAIWLTVVVFTNIVAAVGHTMGVGKIMAMAGPAEDKRIPKILLRRKVDHPGWHATVYWFLVLLQALTAAAIWFACYRFLISSDAVAHARATATANVALSLFTAIWFVMLIGGTWFVYHANNREGIEIIHLALLAFSVACIIMFNIRIA